MRLSSLVTLAALAVTGTAVAPLAPPAATQVELRVGQILMVSDAAVSPDGRLVVTAGPSVLKVWDAETGMLRHVMAYPGLFPDAVRISPDGRLIAVEIRGGAGTEARSLQVTKVLEIQSGREVRTLPAEARLLAFSADSNAIVLGGRSDVSWYELETGSRIRSVDGGPASVSTDGRTLAIVQSAGTKIAVYDVPTGDLRSTITGRNMGAACLPADGKWLVVPSVTYKGASISAVTTATGQTLWTHDAPGGREEVDLACTGDSSGGVLVTGRSRGRPDLDMAFFDAATGEAGSVSRITEALRASAVSPDGRTAITVTSDQPRRRSRVAVRDLKSGTERDLLTWSERLEPRLLERIQVRFSADGKTALVLGPAGAIRAFATDPWRERWNAPTAVEPEALMLTTDGDRLVAVFPAEVVTWAAHSGMRLESMPVESLTHVTPLPDGLAAVTSSVGVLAKLEFRTGKPRWTQKVEPSTEAAVVSSGGTSIAVPNSTIPAENPRAQIVDGATGRVRCTAKPKGFLAPAIALSPDGSLMATSDDRQVAIWDASTCRRLQTLSGRNGLTTWLAWSQDGGFLAAGEALTGRIDRSSAPTSTIWNARTWQPLRTEPAETALVFERDGRLYARVADGALRVTETESGRTAATLGAAALRHLDFIHIHADAPAVAFAENGRAIWTSGPGRLQVWRVSDGQLLATIAILTPGLRDSNERAETGTNAEWLAFTPEGYWDGSPGAEQYLTWAEGGLPLAGPEVAARFHRADLVRQALGAAPTARSQPTRTTRMP